MKFKGRLTYRNFLDYFSNKLEKKEKHAFEKKIMQDSFESEAFDGLSKLDASDLEKDMTDLTSRIQARTKEKKRRILVWFPYAASIIILLVLSSVLYYLNQYSSQDQIIGAQMEEMVKEVESPITEPKITKQDSESIDLLEMIEDDLEMEISDADEAEEVELMIVSEEEEVEEEIIPVGKTKEIELIAPVAQLAVARNISKKETEVSAESMQRALEGKVAGLEVKKSRRQKSAKKPIANNLMSDKQIIYGKVVDEDNVPLPGVSIFVKGTIKGVATDWNGQFKLDASDINQDYKLVASFIGFESKEISVSVDSNLLVVLEQDNVSLNEMTVVAFGKQKKESVTGSVTASNNEYENNSWENAKPNKFASIAKFKEYLIEELQKANLKDLHGAHKVKFSFVVEPYGSLSNIKFKGKPDDLLEKEIERLLLNSGKWYPAESGGEAVASKVRISLKLKFD